MPLSARIGHLRAAVACAASVCLAASVGAGEVEVLHYWTSGGEANAAIALKLSLRAKGHTWKDFAVVGGGGDSAMTLLKARVASGNAPAAAQIKGPSIQQWAAEGGLGNIDDVATAGRWTELLPRVVSDAMKHKGHYVAVPVNVHRVNWLWANAAALKKAGARLPATWDEFFVAAQALQKAGIIPLAHGSQPWQNFTLFESVALGVGGAEFYKRALVQLDSGALTSPTMAQVLATFKRIKAYTDPKADGRDWNLATAMVARGEAGMQLMGDWAKAEFRPAGKLPGHDILCVAAPGTAGAYSFNIDSFVMFKVQGDAQKKAQKDLALAIMAPAFQEAFNLDKGSIPVLLNSKMDNFDDCAKLSSKDFISADKGGTLVPSLAHGMAVPPAAANAMKDVVSDFWLIDSMSTGQAMSRLAVAARQP